MAGVGLLTPVAERGREGGRRRDGERRSGVLTVWVVQGQYKEGRAGSDPDI